MLLLLASLTMKDWLDLIVGIAAIVSIIIGVVGLYIAIRSYKNQLNAQVFIEYTKRYSEFMRAIPHGAWTADKAEDLPQPDAKLTKDVFEYLQLCCEEFSLYKKGYLAEADWNAWERIIRRKLQSPLFVREWKQLADEFEPYVEFSKYVQSVQTVPEKSAH